MYTTESIISSILIITVISLSSFGVVRYIKINSTNVSLLGIGIIVIADCVLKGIYGNYGVIAIIGFGLVIGGFIGGLGNKNRDVD